MAGLATRLVLSLFLILCLVACKCEGRGGRGRSGWNSGGGGGGRVSTVGVIMLLVFGIIGGFGIIAFLYICYKGYCSDDSSAKSSSSENVAPANAADTTANSKTTNTTTTPNQPHVAPISTAGACDSGPKLPSGTSTHTVQDAPPPPCYHSVINLEDSLPSSSQATRELSKASCPACALERSNRPGRPAETSRRGDKYKPLKNKFRNFFLE